MKEYPKIYLYRQLVKAKLFIDNHFNESIDLSDIANEAYFSKFHFIRIFKTIYGKTPHQYLTHVRVEKAKELLATGQPVGDVCFAIGFESIGSFSGLFKRYTNASPAAYREKVLARAEEIGKSPLKYIPNCFAEQNGWVKNSNFKEAV